jgi:hypothetical protein
MFEAHAVFTARGDLRSGEVQRVAHAIDHDFDDVRVALICRLGDSLAECGHLYAGVLGERRDDLGDHLRLDEWQISLHVHDDVAAQIAGDLRNTIGTGAMFRSRQSDTTAERFHSAGNTFVIGRDDNRIDAARLCGTPIHVLNHRPASNLGEDFSRKTR